MTGRPPTARDLYGRDDVPSDADDADVDASNAWVVADARTLPVNEVVAEFRQAHDR